MRIKYKIEKNGKASSFSFVEKEYELKESENFANATKITEELMESLHSDEYKIQREKDKLADEAVELLNQTDCKVLPDSPYPDDLSTWISYRAELREVIKGNLSTIPSKPFS